MCVVCNNKRNCSTCRKVDQARARKLQSIKDKARHAKRLADEAAAKAILARNPELAAGIEFSYQPDRGTL
jgi:DICT domain-containing protein